MQKKKKTGAIHAGVREGLIGIWIWQRTGKLSLSRCRSFRHWLTSIDVDKDDLTLVNFKSHAELPKITYMKQKRSEIKFSIYGQQTEELLWVRITSYVFVSAPLVVFFAAVGLG